MAIKSVGGIYEIVNLVNGKRYIGSAVSFRTRFAAHKHRLIQGNHHSLPLQRAWSKYGQHNFCFRKILICCPSDLLLFEQRAFDTLKPEYNICKTAGSSLGVKWSDDARARHSILQRNDPAFLGRKHSPETIKLMSESQKGRPSPTKGIKRNKSAVENTAKAHRGRKRSEETRARISAAMTGKKRPPMSDETRAKLSERFKGKKKSAEHMAALQAGRAATIFTDERRAAVSHSLKIAYAQGRHRRDRPVEYREKISNTLRARKFGAST